MSAAKLDAFQLVMSYDVQVGREVGNKFEITSSNPEKLVSTTRKCSPSEVAYSTGILRVRVLENWNYMYTCILGGLTDITSAEKKESYGLEIL